MSLIRQIWVLLFATLSLALLGSVSVFVDASRESLQTQLQIKNSDNAQSLAMVLSQQQGDADSMELLMTAQFDTGFYRRLRFIGADGSVRFEREASAAPLHAPAWFADWLRLESAPGLAQVSDGWRALGGVEVQSHAAFAHDELWRGSQRAAAALALVGVLAGLLALAGVARLRRPLDAAIAQARALEQGEYVMLKEPPTPELRRLTSAMNSMVLRLKLVFEGQASQVEALRRQANNDPLTGLSNRKHFLSQLGSALQSAGSAHGGLVLLRVIDLAEVNRNLGHAATDAMLGAIAQVLQSHAQRGDGSWVGRLNGSDFALGLAGSGLAEASGLALAGALRSALPAFGPNLGIALGGVEISRPMLLGELMGAADMALARAETRGAFSVEIEGEAPVVSAGLGEAAWRQHINAALAAGRLQLAETPVVAAGNRLVHLACGVRLQLEPDGEFEVAARWLPLAIRGRLTAQIDTAAVRSAMREIGNDGRPRCLSVAAASLADIEFVPALMTLLAHAPRAAAKLSLAVAESAAIEQSARVRELARQLRTSATKLGLEHAGHGLARIDRLFDSGLHFVKLDSAVIVGVATDPNHTAFIRGAVAMLHSVTIQVYADGVSTQADAAVLESCGVEGLAGPWVGAEHAAAAL